jgi:hypothetical protein
MQSNKTQSNDAFAPVYRAVPQPAQEAPAPEIQPGDIGAAAVTDAANHQLDRYAQDVEAYLQSSKVDALLDKLRAEIDPAEPPRLRLRRE